jgi:hypothetical protein
MSNIKLLNLSLSFLSLLGLIDLVLARPSYAENTQQGCDAQIFPYGDVLFYNNNNNLILSTNNLNNNDSALGNQIGNSYNFSGNPAIPAEEVEQNLGLPLGQLSPDLNFVQATKASAVTLKINPLKNSGCKLLITFLTNDATIIQQGDDQDFIFDDYAFVVENNQFKRIASTNILETSLSPSETILPTTDKKFLREARKIYELVLSPEFPEVSLGVTNVGDEDRTSGVQAELILIPPPPPPIPEPSSLPEIFLALGFSLLLKQQKF